MSSLKELQKIGELIKDDKIEDAQKLFKELAITDSRTHLELPANLRFLVWELHEFLVVGDTCDVTDKETILKKIAEVLSN